MANSPRLPEAYGSPGPAPLGPAGLERVRSAANVVVAWLVVGALWLAASWWFWTLEGSLTSVRQEGGGSMQDSADRTLLIVAVVMAVAVVGIAGLLPAVRRGVSSARVTLASVMIGMALAHVAMLLFMLVLMVIGAIVGFFVMIGGDGDRFLDLIIAFGTTIALEGALIVLAIVCAVKLFRAGPRRDHYPPPPPVAYPSSPGATAPPPRSAEMDRYGPPPEPAAGPSDRHP